MRKEIYEYDNKTWKIESDHTTCALTTSFVKNGVARTEFVFKQGAPQEIEEFLKGKKYHINYAWNIKTLSREVLNKHDAVKFRENAMLQAEGINGEGKKFSNGQADEIEKGTPLVDTKTESFKRTVSKWSLKIWALILIVASLLTGLTAILYKLIKGE